MSIEAFEVQRVRAYNETNTQFSVDHTGTLGDFADVPIQGTATFTKPKALYDPQLVQQIKDGRSEKVVGRRGPWTLTFTCPLASHGTAPTNGVQSGTDVLGTLFKAMMGAENRGTGTTIASGAAATGYVLTANTGWISGMVGAPTIGSAKVWRPAKTLSGSTIAHAIATASAPSGGADVAASTLYTFTEDPDTSLQFIVQHAESNSCWVLLGGQGSYSISIPNVGLPTVTYSVSGHYWLHGSEAAGSASLDGYTIASATMPSLGYAKAESGEFLQWTNGTATYTASDPYTTEGSQVHIAEETWTVNTTWVDVTSPNAPAVEGILRKVRLKTEVSVGFRCPYQGTFWQSALDNATDKAFFRRIGTAAGSVICLHAPTTQVEEASDPVNVNGLLYQNVLAVGRQDGETTASGAAQYSIFKLTRG